jgi:hypothetical protein
MKNLLMKIGGFSGRRTTKYYSTVKNAEKGYGFMFTAAWVPIS